jgi:sulfide dehydrogenase cytochrome subunit
VRIPIVIVASLLCGVVSAQTSADSLYVRANAATCANCHGTDGQSVAVDYGLQRLAGMEKTYIVEQLNAFREGKRPATIMHQLVKGYTPAQIDAIAAFFAAQK